MFMKCPYSDYVECEVDYHTPACMQGKGDKYCLIEFRAKYPEEYAEKERLKEEERQRQIEKEEENATTIAFVFGIGIVLIVLSLLFALVNFI